MGLAVEQLSIDDQKLLIELLLDHQYALELISSELNDIESGSKMTDDTTYQRLLSLYDQIRFEGS
ncbi:antirepressor AbbA [Metabacillus herbersteinensis]|uniref:Antirepressor AbbA n=1 Tax=Metabacillus herbersteinensis TaxID=283816 RepID=A0ABV6GAL6_9BACI